MLLRQGMGSSDVETLQYLCHGKAASWSFHLGVQLFTAVLLSRPGYPYVYLISTCHPISVYFTVVCIGTDVDLKYC
jgi:3-methyladenine DNA glycosylase Mpg